MAGMSSLFPDFPKQIPVMDRVKIIIQRHKNNYFKDGSTQELDDADVSHITRPLQDITDNIFKEHIKKNEVTRNRKLQFCLEAAESDNPPTWATQFWHVIVDAKLVRARKIQWQMECNLNVDY
jgi:hypothetical protein